MESNQDLFRIGSVLLNAGTQEVTRDGVPIPLPPLSFSLLLTLARHAPNVVTTQQLEQEVWSGLVVDRGTINKRVLLVRQALREAGCEDNYITVVRGTGYRMAVTVEALSPDSATTSPPSLDPLPVSDRELPELPSFNLRTMTIAAALLLLVIVGWQLGERSNAPGEPESAGSAIRPVDLEAVTPSKSLAVLPFKDMDAPDGAGFFGLGIAREVGDLLSRNSSLVVASSRSTSAFAGSDAPLPEVAARLGVGSVLRGTVHRFNDQIHVSVELVDVDSGYVLWSQNYERPLNDVFDIQDSIVTSVAATLESALAQGPPDSRQASSGSVDAFTLFLHGRSLLDERIQHGVQGIRDALGYFEQAIESDPEFVRAHVGRASAMFLLPAYDPLLPAEEHLAQAEASARYALELDATSTEALGVLAAILVRRGVPVQAAALFSRAQELGNNDPNIVHWHAMLFSSMGYFTDLVPILDEAYRLDPLNPLLGCSLASAFNLSGHPEQAARVLREMPSFSRRDIGLALASIYVGDYATARQMLSGVEFREGVLPAAYAEKLVDAFENPLQYDGVVQAFVDGAHRNDLPPLVAFEALIIMGSPRAFDLEVDVRGSHFEFTIPEESWNNWGVSLRRDPRFKNWIKSLGYDQYWRSNEWPDRCKPTGLDDFECI